jgi:anti-anti-sigma regulatory factor
MATGTVILNCARIKNPSVAAIDYLARLKLGLRRGDCEMCLANCSEELKQLIELAGLAGVLAAPLGVQVEGQSEEREKLRRIEEEGELADPPA